VIVDQKFPNFVTVSYFHCIPETPFSSLPTELIACSNDWHAYVDREVDLWVSFTYEFDQLFTITEPFFTDTIKLYNLFAFYVGFGLVSCWPFISMSDS